MNLPDTMPDVKRSKDSQTGAMFLALSLAMYGLLLFVTGACSGDAIWEQASQRVDREAPYVIGTIPANGKANVSPGQDIYITFSEAIDARSLPEQSIQVHDEYSNQIAGSYKTSTTNNAVLHFSPEGHWNRVTTYYVSVSSNIADRNGNAMLGEYTFSFQTLDSLHLDWTLPESGAYIGPNPKIALIFNSEIADSVISDNTYISMFSESDETIACNLTFGPEQRILIVTTSEELDRNNTYRLEIASSLPDAYGATLDADYSLSFTVSEHPVLVYSHPGPNTADFHPDQPVEFYFSEAMMLSDPGWSVSIGGNNYNYGSPDVDIVDDYTLRINAALSFSPIEANSLTTNNVQLSGFTNNVGDLALYNTGMTNYTFSMTRMWQNIADSSDFPSTVATSNPYPFDIATFQNRVYVAACYSDGGNPKVILKRFDGCCWETLADYDRAPETGVDLAATSAAVYMSYIEPAQKQPLLFNIEDNTTRNIGAQAGISSANPAHICRLNAQPDSPELLILAVSDQYQMHVFAADSSGIFNPTAYAADYPAGSPVHSAAITRRPDGLIELAYATYPDMETGVLYYQDGDGWEDNTDFDSVLGSQYGAFPEYASGGGKQVFSIQVSSAVAGPWNTEVFELQNSTGPDHFIQPAAGYSVNPQHFGLAVNSDPAIFVANRQDSSRWPWIKRHGVAVWDDIGYSDGIIREEQSAGIRIAFTEWGLYAVDIGTDAKINVLEYVGLY